MTTTSASRGLLAFALVVPAGCGLHRAYEAPRTTPQGRLGYTIASPMGPPPGSPSYSPALVPEGIGFPAFTLRYGLTDCLEASASAGPGVGAAVKWNFVRSSWFDAAVAPRVGYFAGLAGSDFALTMDLPAPLAINLGPAASIVLTPAMLWSRAYVAPDEGPGPVMQETKVAGSAALGLDLRLTRKFAIHPAVIVYRALDTGPVLVAGGLGFHFGNLARYD